MDINLSKKQGRFLQEIIQHWEQESVIDPDTKSKLLDSYKVRPFDWKRLAKYSFWVSLICLIISLAAVFADDFILEFLTTIFTSSSIVMAIVSAVAAAGFLFWAFRRRITHPNQIFSNEFLVVLAAVATASSIGYLGITFDNGSGHFPILFLLAVIAYGLIGAFFPSKLLWTLAILCLGAWFGTETGYVSGWGAYYLGMNFPLRFVAFGAILTALSFVFHYIPTLAGLRKTTFILGLLNLFIALWIMSIFGNYGDMHDWYHASKLDLLGWGLLFGAVAIAAIVYGLKADDATSRGFGIVFLFINLYTKYFEYFWNHSHKALFFIILAATFWLVGKNAEKIWNLKFLGHKEMEEG
jgi:hypothetical protein